MNLAWISCFQLVHPTKTLNHTADSPFLLPISQQEQEQ